MWWLGGCTETPDGAWVSKITDLKGDTKAVWHLNYDRNGRLVRYGNTKIDYEDGKIHVGRMAWRNPTEELESATFFFSQGSVLRSEARCRLCEGEARKEFLKETDYLERGDTIRTDIRYSDIGDGHIFRRGTVCYVYNADGNLSEVIARYWDEEKGEDEACHSYYDYKNNIRYKSNLNLEPFFVDVEGTDTFFYFLLGLGRRTREKRLPDGIRYCINHGEAAYVADGLYRLDGDQPTRAEVVSDNLKLKARLEFEYFK